MGDLFHNISYPPDIKFGNLQVDVIYCGTEWVWPRTTTTLAPTTTTTTTLTPTTTTTTLTPTTTTTTLTPTTTTTTLTPTTTTTTLTPTTTTTTLTPTTTTTTLTPTTTTTTLTPTTTTTTLTPTTTTTTLTPTTTTTTLALSIPTVITSSISSIGYDYINGGGNVISDGGSSVTQRGICWSTTSGSESYIGSHTSDGTGLGVFTSSATTLVCGTVYYLKAYAINSIGVGYGSEVTGKTVTNSYPNAILWYAISISTCPNGTYTFSSTSALFDQAWSDIKLGCATGFNGATSKIEKPDTVNIVGQQLFLYNSCVFNTISGYYLYQYPYIGNAPPGGTWYKLYILNGVVQSITLLV